jgi:hypothetical protein
VRQELLSLFGKRLGAPGAAALAIKLRAKPGLQGQEAIADALFRDVQNLGDVAQAALASELDECGDLIGGEGNVILNVYFSSFRLLISWRSGFSRTGSG